MFKEVFVVYFNLKPDAEMAINSNKAAVIDDV
jgi:hypothetical protein